jgi:hypothetical protein
MASTELPVQAAVFACSGVAISLLQQRLAQAGAGDPSLLILVVPIFTGMIIGGFLSSAGRAELSEGRGGVATQLPWRCKQALVPSLLLFFSAALQSVSRSLCGAGMFTVIYAALPAFNGLLSYAVLGRVLSRRQWLCIAAVVGGLAASTPLAEEVSLMGCWGFLLGLAGTILQSLSYVVSERLLKSPGAPKQASTLSAASGLNDLILVAPWMLFYSAPNLDALLFKPVVEKGLFSGEQVAVFWCLLVGANAIHMNACYTLLRLSESVTLTMLQGVRVVAVFAFTGALFCDDDSTHHCLSAQKAGGSAVVLLGFFFYAQGTAGLSKHVGGPGPRALQGGGGGGGGYKESEEGRRARHARLNAEAEAASYTVADIYTAAEDAEAANAALQKSMMERQARRSAAAAAASSGDAVAAAPLMASGGDRTTGYRTPVQASVKSPAASQYSDAGDGDGDGKEFVV